MIHLDGQWVRLGQGGRRVLLIPMGIPPIQQVCLDYLVNNRWRAVWMRAQLWASAVVHSPKLLSERESLDISLRTSLQELRDKWPGFRGSYMGVLVAQPGPLQKATVLIVEAEGKAKALIKMALTPMADQYLQREAYFLETLTGEKGVGNSVPRLSEQGVLTNGRRYLVQTVGPKRLTNYNFTESHQRFLSVLGRRKAKLLPLAGTTSFEQMKKALHAVRKHVSKSVTVSLASSLKDYERQLSTWNGPATLAHRDFVASNIRMNHHGIFVFDWEYALEETNPLQDIFHFHLAYEALHRGRIRPYVFRRALSRAARFAEQTYPEYDWTPRIITAHALGCLLDVLLFYAATSGKVNMRNPMVRSYWNVMIDRASWMR